MAKNKNNKRNRPMRDEDFRDERDDIGGGEDFGGDDSERLNASRGDDRGGMERGGTEAQSSGGRSEGMDFDPRQLLDSFRQYVEGHPGRASVLGAVAGGVAAGLLATDTGRSLLRASFGYARPMLTDYARKFISNKAGDAIEQRLPQ